MPVLLMRYYSDCPMSEVYKENKYLEQTERYLNAGMIGGIQYKEEMNKKVRFLILSNKQFSLSTLFCNIRRKDC